MTRILLVFLSSAIPLFAQSADEEKFRRPFGSYRPAGLLSPRPVDESTIDGEATLRQLLPSEVALVQQDERLQATKQLMQGFWRVETFMLDGTVFRPGEFAGLKYRIRDNVIVQSQESSEWRRPVEYPTTPSRLQTAVDNAQRLQAEPVVVDSLLRHVREERKEWLIPAENPRPVGESFRNDPKAEEGMRLLILHRGIGQAFIYSWDRYGETVDPHNELNRPSARVVLPAVGSVEVGEGRLILAIRGVDLRALLPARLRTPLGAERTLMIRMIRHEQAGQVQATAPTSNPSTGDLSTILGLGFASRQSQIMGADRMNADAPAFSNTGEFVRNFAYSEPQVESKWVVRPLSQVQLNADRRHAVVLQPVQLNAPARTNLIPPMKPVVLASGSK